MPTEIPWAFFLCSSFRSCSLQASRSKIAEDRKTILFFLLLAIFCTWFILWVAREGSSSRASWEAKLQKIANFMFLLLLPIFCNLCHFSICRTKTIFQVSVYQEPFGVVGQRGVARHLRRRCLAQSATFK